MGESPDQRCLEWWPSGLSWGIYHRCVRKHKHTGMHKNEAGDLRWTGKMTAAERELVPA